MQRAWRVLGGIMAIVFIAMALTYFSVGRPHPSFAALNRAQFENAAKLLAACLEKYQAAQCAIYLTPEGNRSFPAAKLAMLAQTVKNKFGKRLSGALEADSVASQQFTGAGGAALMVSFTILAVYEKNAEVRESYRVVKRDHAPVLIESLKIGAEL